jgi:DNA-binding transcriptional regulator YdaS (Cro superfamily)
MLELTKAPRTDGMVVVSATVPAERADAVARAIIEAADDNIPAKDVFHDSTPGKVLAGARGLRGMTQTALAAAIGVHKSHISGMERSVHPIGKAMAKKLGHPLSNDWGAPLSSLE